jgi:hypothetical protein
LFFYPGLALLILGIAISILLLPGPVYIKPNISLDIHTFLVSGVTVLIGMRASFAVVVRRYAAARGLDELLTARPDASSNVRRETFNSSARSRMMGAVNVSALTLNCVRIRPAQAACLPYSS